jgi:mannose-6-phosphate isomerase-like protein (cupin superfamily)
MPTIIDLNAEAAKLKLFRGLTPQSTFVQRQGSTAGLAPFRDGLVTLSKSAGKGHWEAHPADELVYVLDGTTTLEIVEQGRPQSFALRAGMMVIVPQGAWHRSHSADGATVMTATPFPSRHVELDVDDPRTVLGAAAKT